MQEFLEGDVIISKIGEKEWERERERGRERDGFICETARNIAST